MKDLARTVFDLNETEKEQLIKAWTVLGYKTQIAWLRYHIANDFKKALEGETQRLEGENNMERVPSRGVVEAVGFCGLGLGNGMNCLAMGRSCIGCPDYSPNDQQNDI